MCPLVVQTINSNGGYMVVWWNMPPGTEPKTSGDHFVAFGTYNGITAGECGAEHLMEALHGKGSIIALPGVLDSTVSQERYQGLLDTVKKYPDVKLLDTQPANWDQAIALRTTQQLIAKYRDKIDGVWTADDAMMLGAYQAINQAGRLDKVKFSGEGAYPPVIDLMVKKAGKLQRPQEAESYYLKAIELYPKDAYPHNNLGQLYHYQLQKPQEAESCYLKAIELDPKYVYAHNNLGNLYKDKLQRPQEAESCYLKAIELDPKNAYPHNNLGQLYHYQLQRPQEAESCYLKAIELDPKFAAPRNGLSDLRRGAEGS
jgi:ABC-type sugar transport system substrate-binding protein